ncbi:MAG: P-loop NTPase fold protein [Rikenellaceae bacterium]
MRTTPIEIDAENPFANCKLNRERYADVLTSIVESYKDGFVLAVNGKWGTGKTTFMNMWRQSLENKEYRTIYFNAWENDFTSEPMVAILGELKSLTATENSLFDNILEKSAKFSSAILPILAKTAATLAGFGGVADAIEKTSEAALSLINNEIEEYDKKKEALSEIKNDLAAFIKENCGDKPLVFIVDELDRCRPDYAVEVLEKIKHLFAVEGVVFVLSIDKEQLGHAVCGYYGSEKIDSREYLRRFIDLEYTLPKPDIDLFAKHLYDYFDFAKFFEQKNRINNNNLKFEDESFFKLVSVFCHKRNITLRQLEKIFAHTRIVSRCFIINNYVHPDVIFLLMTLKEYNNSLYESIKTNSLTLEALAQALDEEFGVFTSDTNRTNGYFYFEFAITLMIKFYSIQNRIDSPIITNDEGIKDLNFALKYTDTKRIAELFSYGGERNWASIAYYTNKIDLLENLKL